MTGALVLSIAAFVLGAGVYGLVPRRELARLVGDEAVRAEMSESIRGLARALLQGTTYPAVTSLEGLIAARGW